MSVINVKEEQSLAEDESELRNEDILDIKYQDIKSEVEQMNYDFTEEDISMRVELKEESEMSTGKEPGEVISDTKIFEGVFVKELRNYNDPSPKTNVDVHTRVHRVDPQLKCEISKKTFTCERNSSVQEKVKICSGQRTHQCDICKKEFKRSHELKRHRGTHFNEHPFKCEICERNFTQSGSLNAHMKTHLSKRPYECEICGKGCNRLRNLELHKMSHSSKRPYNCAICEKTFTQSRNLKTHERLHLNERPYQCAICDKCFSQSGTLKKHARIHINDRPYKCEMCNKTFSESGNLKIHERIHTDVRPYICEICKKGFTQLSNLKRHKLVHFDVIHTNVYEKQLQ